MKRKAVLAFLILVTVVFIVPISYASVPKVHTRRVDSSGNDVNFTIKISHQQRSESHYVDIVEVKMDGRTLNFTELEPQTADIFSLNGTFNNADLGIISVRAHCVTHGWCNWTQTSPQLVFPSSLAGTNDKTENDLSPNSQEKPIWYPLVVPLTMMLLLVLMKWRKMIP